MSEKPALLIIEDALDIQDLLREVFEAEGYAVQSAMNGQEALDWLQRADPLPGVILLDLTLPVMSGYDFRRHQEEDPRLAKIPVVVMSAAADTKLTAAHMGAAGHLKKPFIDIDSLLGTVAGFFNGPDHEIS